MPAILLFIWNSFAEVIMGKQDMIDIQINACNVERRVYAYFNHKLVMQLAECQPQDFKPGQ